MPANKPPYGHRNHQLRLHHDRDNLDTPNVPLRLLQLTDSHLFADPGGRLLGITTRASFEAVLDLALDGTPKADALVLTGDLVHDESSTGYRYLRETLKLTGLPHYCIAGNHDRPPLLSEHLGAAGLGSVALRRLHSWNLIFMDSSEAGRDGGRLDSDQMRQLEDLLTGDAAPALLFLHHHPIPVQSAWMDTMGVDNGAELLGLCARHPQVKAIVFGHIHQSFECRQGALQILGAPSTCIQFLPGSASFALDQRPPGYRELLLYPDGRLTSQVIRLAQYAELPLYQAGGY